VKRTLVFVLLIACVACNKKSADTPTTTGNRSTGTLTTTDNASNKSSSGRDLAGTWIANEGPRVWELVITRVDAKTFSGTPTLVSNSEKDGLIDYGPPGSKGDSIIIISDQPGTFRVRWAKAEHLHGVEFWEGTGTYDDNSFNFPGQYVGKRKN
jgi:hypothetical protein